jgi:hypothetical protein
MHFRHGFEVSDGLYLQALLQLFLFTIVVSITTTMI